MSMVLSTRRSGMTLATLGVVGVVFFWLTDPRLGPIADVHRHANRAHWLTLLRGSPDNLVDAANQALTGTLVGIAGSIAILIVGIWLLTRRKT